MQRTHLPSTDLAVHPICLGGTQFGDPAKADRWEAILDAYLAAGGNFIDTAHVYNFWIDGGDGLSERTIGRLLRTRETTGFVVATKGGHPSMGEKYPQPDRYLSPEALATHVQQSLERLQRDTIDLYYLHRDDTRVPVGEVIDALNALGPRVRHFGVSNWSIERIAAANAYAASHGLRGIVINQPQWSLAESNRRHDGTDLANRQLSASDVSWHQQTQLPVAAYTATGGGFFAGRASKQFDTPANHARRERARELAEKLNVTPTQIALAWLRSHDFVVVPIIGSADVDHVREAMGTADVQLTAQQGLWLSTGHSGH